MIFAVLNPFGSFSASGGDVTPDAVNWGNLAVTVPYIGRETTANQTISGITSTIQVKITLDSGGDVGWAKNNVEGDVYPTSSTVAVNNGDQLYIIVSAEPTPATTGAYYSGAYSVTNESDGSAVLDTGTYAVQFIPGA